MDILPVSRISGRGPFFSVCAEQGNFFEKIGEWLKTSREEGAVVRRGGHSLWDDDIVNNNPHDERQEVMADRRCEKTAVPQDRQEKIETSFISMRKDS